MSFILCKYARTVWSCGCRITWRTITMLVSMQEHGEFCCMLLWRIQELWQTSHRHICLAARHSFRLGFKLCKTLLITLACPHSGRPQLRESSLLNRSKGNLEWGLPVNGCHGACFHTLWLQSSKGAWHLCVSPCTSVCIAMYSAGPMCAATWVVCSFTASLQQQHKSHTYRPS